MAGSRSLSRAGVRAGCTVGLLVGLLLSPVAAQQAALPVLTIDQNRLFIESAFGRASLERERIAGQALEDENAAIEAELVNEERDLTARRKTTEADEFVALANAFDQKVENIRTAQDAKARDLGRTREADQQTFRRAAGPIIGKLMTDKGAVVIIDRASVVLSAPAIDVTDEAIVRIDAALGPQEIAPAPNTPAELAPDPADTDPADMAPVTPPPTDAPTTP